MRRSETTAPLAHLLTALAALYVAEPRDGGLAAAAALREAADGPLPAPCNVPAPLAAGLAQVLTGADASLAAAIRAALPWIVWELSRHDGRICDEYALHMMTAEILGPDGILHHDNLRVGLFLQSGGLAYPTRAHAAEETFIMLAGQGLWQAGDGPALLHGAGVLIHHPGMVPHSSTTLPGQPLLAAWRWSGDIGFDSYLLTG
ncbi:hypothetical protein DDZ14_02420 [Maritimibacter sp. 55A14]|uniref:dimethylsulfonioproprionate lyase family protein n=1 Tax=Maritimibacter sp. 55A14 TaxID=2174844 RepID=UPI000D603446|nr:dimethylsulfonioproprionate lyase family protein [Maritimibacter sp. 55A14]PWE34037.1 hypothetical protein DDZ14_02420 [Maritimibacter sp. 55A14]